MIIMMTMMMIIIIITTTGRKEPDAVRSSPTVKITKLGKFVDRKEDPLIQVVRTQQHNTD